MKKIFLFASGTGLILLLFVLLAQDLIIGKAFQYVLSRELGVRVKIDQFHYQYPGAFHMQGVRFYNPPGFEEPVFAEFSRIYMIFNMPEFVRREKLYIYFVDMSLSAIHFQKTKTGTFNLMLLKPLAGDGRASAGRLPFTLDKLQMSVRNADYLDSGNPDTEKMTLRQMIEREESGPFKSLRNLIEELSMRIIEGIHAEKSAPSDASPNQETF